MISVLFARYRGRSEGAGARLDIEEGFHFASGTKVVSVRQADGLMAFRETAAALLPLVEQSVKKAVVETAGSLWLEFSDGSTLRLLVSDAGFESYHLHTQL